MILMMGELELCSRITQEETIVRSHQMLRQSDNKQDIQHYQHLARHYYNNLIKNLFKNNLRITKLTQIVSME